MTTYYANPIGKDGSPGKAAILAAMTEGRIGYIDTPAQGNIRPEGVN